MSELLRDNRRSRHPARPDPRPYAELLWKVRAQGAAPIAPEGRSAGRFSLSAEQAQALADHGWVTLQSMPGGRQMAVLTASGSAYLRHVPPGELLQS